MSIIRNIPNNNFNNNFNDSLFNCFSQLFPSCLCSLLCPCILMGQLAEAIHFSPCLCVCSCYSFILILFIIIGIFYNAGELIIWITTALFIWSIRQRIRIYYSMTTNIVEDFFVSFFCSCCALSQVYSLLLL